MGKVTLAESLDKPPWMAGGGYELHLGGEAVREPAHDMLALVA